MKRRLVKLVLLLLVAGAIVNIAVAWGCAVYEVLSPEWVYAFENRSDELRFWDAFDEGTVAPVEVVSVVRETAFGTTVTSAKARLPSVFVPAPDLTKPGMVYTGPPIPQGATTVEVKQEAWIRVCDSGWPIGSLRQSRFYAPGISKSHGAWEWSSRARSLPVSPLWPGFAINTVFYALVLWLLFAAPFALRRRRRIKRGLCPKCAYDLRGAGSKDAVVCPECGAKAVPS